MGSRLLLSGLVGLALALGCGGLATPEAEPEPVAAEVEPTSTPVRVEAVGVSVEGETAEFVRKFLVVSPRWSVRENGVATQLMRSVDRAGFPPVFVWYEPVDGWQTRGDEERWRVRMGTGDEPEGEWTKLNWDAGAVEVPLSRAAFDAPFDSAVLVRGPTFWLAIEESGPAEERPRTVAALESVNTELTKVVESGVLPKMPINPIGAAFGVYRGRSEAEVHTVGFADPGEPGVGFVRMFFVEWLDEDNPAPTLGPALSASSTAPSRRMLGHNTGVDVYPYYARFTIDEHENEPFLARFEFWFDPDDGERRKLGEAEFKVW